MRVYRGDEAKFGRDLWVAKATAASVIPVVSYLRLVAGARFALREAGIAQFVYLVLFSFSFFFEGYTRPAIAIGAIVTLFVGMQMTGRTDWSRIFAAPAPLTNS